MCLVPRSLLVLVSFVVACDYNNDGTLPLEPDATVSPDARDASAPARPLDGGAFGPMDARIGSDAEGADAGVSNESFETARLITPGPDRVLQDIEHSEQTSYFAFDAPSAGFYELSTAATNFSPDVVLALHDGARTLIAQNDGGSLFPGDDIDARLVVRLPRGGRYFVVVHDPSTPTAFFAGKGKPIRYFTLTVRALEPATPGVTYERAGEAAAVSFALDEASGYSYTTLLGTLEPGTLDTFTVQGLSDNALIGHLLASGTLGNGATASPGPVRLVDTQQQKLLAEIDGTPQHLALFPPVTGAAYQLTARAPAVVGDNAFYALDLVLLPDNPRERDELGNAELAGAELVQLQGVARRRGLLLAEVPPGDVDYFRFDASAGETVLVSCEGEAAGSGVRMLNAQLRDAADRTLVTAVESAAHDLDVEAYNVATTGPHYLRLASDRVARGTGASPWVRCVVLVAAQ